MAKDILKYPGWMYAYGISSGQLPMSEARVEYMRIYKALKSRQKRLQQSEFAGSKFARQKLVPLREIKTEAQFNEEIQSLASMARSRLTSISGLREYQEDIAIALNRIGGDGIDFNDLSASGWKEFGTYMKRVHQAQFDSERAVKMFRIAKEAGLSGGGLFKDYSYWLEHVEQLKDYNVAGNPLGSRVSSKRLREYMSGDRSAVRSAIKKSKTKSAKKRAKAGLKAIKRIEKIRTE